MTHNAHIHLWETRERQPVHAGPPHDHHTFDEYLRWLHRSTRTHIKPPYIEEAIDEDSKAAYYRRKADQGNVGEPSHSNRVVVEDWYSDDELLT